MSMKSLAGVAVKGVLRDVFLPCNLNPLNRTTPKKSSTPLSYIDARLHVEGSGGMFKVEGLRLRLVGPTQ